MKQSVRGQLDLSMLRIYCATTRAITGCAKPARDRSIPHLVSRHAALPCRSHKQLTAEPIRFDCIFFTGGKKNAEPVPVGPVLIVTLPCPDGYGGCVARRSSCVVMCVAQMRAMCVVVCGRARCVVVVCSCCVVRLVQHDSTVILPLGVPSFNF